MYGGAPDPREFAEASDILLAAGERDLAAEAMALAATSETNRGSQDAVWEYMRRAEELIRGAPSSRSKAFVLHWNAVGYSLAGSPEEALASARQALEIAEALGLDDIRANSLSTIGMTRISLGDPGGIEDQERSVEIAREANSADVMRSLGNLASSLTDFGRLSEARERLDQALAEAQRSGASGYAIGSGPSGSRTCITRESGTRRRVSRVSCRPTSNAVLLTTFMEGGNRRSVRASAWRAAIGRGAGGHGALTRSGPGREEPSAAPSGSCLLRGGAGRTGAGRRGERCGGRASGGLAHAIVSSVFWCSISRTRSFRSAATAKRLFERSSRSRPGPKRRVRMPQATFPRRSKCSIESAPFPRPPSSGSSRATAQRYAALEVLPLGRRDALLNEGLIAAAYEPQRLNSTHWPPRFRQAETPSPRTGLASTPAATRMLAARARPRPALADRHDRGIAAELVRAGAHPAVRQVQAPGM